MNSVGPKNWTVPKLLNERGASAVLLSVVVLSVVVLYTMFAFMQSSTNRLSFRRATHRDYENRFLAERQLTVIFANPVNCSELLAGQAYTQGMSPVAKKAEGRGWPSYLERREISEWVFLYEEAHRGVLNLQPKSGERPLRIPIYISTHEGLIQKCSSDASKVAL